MKAMPCTRALCAAFLALLGAAAAQADDPGLAMVRAKMCTNCHGFGGRIVGPGWFQVAERRADEDGALERVALRIRQGSVGEWGSTPMPPMPVNDAEALLMARWVLSRRRD